MADSLHKVDQATTSSSSGEVSVRHEEEVEVQSGQNVGGGGVDAGDRSSTVITFSNGGGDSSGFVD